MSNLSMNQAEEQAIDSKIEQMMDWAQSRKIEAEQLALDSARLMACATDRLDRLSKQGFYKRCWSRFNGDSSAMEHANVNDVIQMQKMAFRYVNMLQEQQLLMAHSLLSLKNNLNSLAVKEEETRNLIAMLAQRTLQRFEELEGRVGKLETSSNLHDWLFTLEERDYEEKIPTDYMRLLRIINDFYGIKNDNWNNNDLMFMRKAIRTVGLNPKEKLSINAFIDKLADEIQSSEVGFDAYDKAITLFTPDGIENYSQFAIANVSSPVFATLHGLNTQYKDRLDMVEDLQDDLGCSQSEALKKLLRKTIQRMNVNLDYEFPLAETAIEILGCMRLAERLNNHDKNQTNEVDENDNQEIGQDSPQIQLESSESVTIEEKKSPLTVDNWQNSKLPFSEDIESVALYKDKIFVSHTNEIWGRSDKSNWKQITTIPSGGRGKLICTKNKLFFIPDSCIYEPLFMSDDGDHWEKVNLPEDVNGKSISYQYVMRTDLHGIFAGTYNASYTYKKKGLIFDSEDTSYYSAGAFLAGEFGGKWKRYSSAEQFYKMYFSQLIISENKFYALYSEQAHKGLVSLFGLASAMLPDTCKLAVSSDGYTWKSIDFVKLEKVLSIFPFKNGILVSKYDGMFILDYENQTFTQIEIPEEFLGMRESNMYYFPDHSLYVVNNPETPSLALTHNFIDWKNISTPTEERDNICLSDNILVYSNKNCIYYGNLQS